MSTEDTKKKIRKESKYVTKKINKTQRKRAREEKGGGEARQKTMIEVEIASIYQ